MYLYKILYTKINTYRYIIKEDVMDLRESRVEDMEELEGERQGKNDINNSTVM